MRVALTLAAMLMATPAAAQDHSQMDHAAMGHEMPSAAPDTPSSAGPPPRARQGPAHAADTVWGGEAMAPSRSELFTAMPTGTLMVERLEARLGAGEDGFLWDIQAFYGGDLNRLALKSEGEGAFGGDVEGAEVQALWSHAITPFFDLQAGMRLDLEPDMRSHAVIGVQGLAPYMIHLDTAAFLSDRGDLIARVEAEYDQKITQSLILQPRLELSLSAQDIPECETGAGLTSVEAGLRLRYEISREFAPYLGVGYETKLGGTRDMARLAGDDPTSWRVLAGIRAWF